MLTSVPSTRRSARGSWSTVLVSVVFAVAMGALLLQEGSVPHLHDDPAPGVYNHDHDLTLLAAFGGGAPMPDGAPAVSALPSVPAAPCAVVSRAAASPLRYSASRAPPSAS